MRPAEFPAEAIIEAGQALQAAGRNVTGFALRQKVGGGNPTRLKQVWDDHLAKVQPVVELPVEIADALAQVTKSLTEQLATLGAGLYARVDEDSQRKIAAAQRAAAIEVDAATDEADSFKAERDDALAEVETLTNKLAESQAHAQAQAVELAQLRERLAASEQTNRADAEKHAAELARAHEAAERLRVELEALRKSSAAELDQVRVELASVKATAESDLRHAREEARNHQLATEQANGLLARVREEFEQARSQASSAREEARSHQLAAEQANALLGQAREELAQTRKQSSDAREEAARLRGQVEAIEGQRAELVKVLAERPVAAEKGADKAEKPAGKGTK